MSNPDELCPLDPSTLLTVTGGLASGGSSGNQTDTQLQLALQSIKSSISDIGKTNQNGSGDAMSTMLPMLMMMKQRQG